MKKHKALRIILIMFTAIIVGMIIAGAVYVNDYYRANNEAMSALESDDYVNVTVTKNDNIIFQNNGMQDSNIGFIFYPGGKVDYRAYAPLMKACSENGILCVLVKMPFNLAVLDQNAADGIKEQFSQIDHWYMGGHSLGGSMAAAYISKHVNEYEGLVLLGAYSVNDLSQSGLKVLSVYGSQDHVMNAKKYENNEKNLPFNYTKLIISGGCHAYFGMYGQQEKDGIPSITNQEQIRQTAQKINTFTTNR